MKDWNKFSWLVGIFLVACYIPLGNTKFTNAILESIRPLQWYAVNHTLACVVPALSLPSILVINRIIGGKKTFVFCSLVVGMSTVVGFLFGMMH